MHRRIFRSIPHQIKGSVSFICSVHNAEKCSLCYNNLNLSIVQEVCLILCKFFKGNFTILRKHEAQVISKIEVMK